jgi:hypothetical protein
MTLCVGSYFIAGFAVAIDDQAFGQSIIIASVDTSLLVALAYLGLWARDSIPRATQTITALAGTGTLFELLGWPLVTYLQTLQEGETSGLALLLPVLVIWNIAVIGNILKHALEIPMWIGTGIALLYIYTAIRVMSVLYIAGGV